MKTQVSGVSGDDNDPPTHMEALLISIWAGFKGAGVRVAVS